MRLDVGVRDLDLGREILDGEQRIGELAALVDELDIRTQLGRRHEARGHDPHAQVV
jgi:hypothetical protein